MKYIIAFLIFFFNATLVHAETCPAIADIKAGYFGGWRVLSSDNGSPLSPAGVEKFKRSITSFVMAEYAEEAPEGEDHCYYRTEKSSCAAGFLAKDGLKPQMKSGFWYNESIFVRCHQSIASCIFI